MAERPGSRPRVALFVTCMVDTLYPRVGMAAVDLLERHGADVVFPHEQTCCGQPAFNAGYRADARRMARHFLAVFWPLIDQRRIDAIVAPSGSCVAMVRHFYRILFDEAASDEDRRRALQVGAATYELTEYLVDVLGVEVIDAQVKGKLTYHPCCHLLRELGVDAQPRRLLAGLRGAELVELPGADECCGFGGLFALKNAEISTAMGRRKARNLAASGADLVVMNDVSCMTHLNGILKRQGHRCRAVHIAELLNRVDEHGSADRDPTNAR
ncbi:MAG: Fe-S oxidoreductase [Gemmatimonas sp. SM23_52]|nr:MAG: Fe-S oxidoreductase [Gemmatimonas sp. SM23_52]